MKIIIYFAFVFYLIKDELKFNKNINLNNKFCFGLFLIEIFYFKNYFFYKKNYFILINSIS